MCVDPFRFLLIYNTIILSDSPPILSFPSMADPSAPLPAAAADSDEELEIELVNPDQELAALITRLSELSKLAVDLSERCIDLDGRFTVLSQMPPSD
jgi:hypothetical protein